MKKNTLIKTSVKTFTMTLVFTCFSLQAFAQSKEEVSGMLDQLSAKGMMNKAQLEEARKQLGKMSDKDFQRIIEQGKAMRNDPKIKAKLKELNLGM